MCVAAVSLQDVFKWKKECQADTNCICLAMEMIQTKRGCIFYKSNLHFKTLDWDHKRTQPVLTGIN